VEGMIRNERTIEDMVMKLPILKDLQAREEVFWINPYYISSSIQKIGWNVTKEEIIDASKRLERFAPFIVKAFPETIESRGVLESPLLFISEMKSHLENRYQQPITGNLLLKCDNQLPISGSIKARGGIYEVLKHAEDIAFKHGLLNKEDDYSIVVQKQFKELFSQYSIAVGSTGNLGLSIGLMGAKLGFHVTVHMSADAKMWKKKLLRSLGVTVMEYASDYSVAVEEGRKQASTDPFCYFIDDESSKHLFLGYSVAALRLEKQITDLGIVVDDEHPLFVYLPCGVGGGPGGITYGLKTLYHQNVHCFFAEPTESPCMLIGMATGLNDDVSVQEFGISNQTVADGLAVGRASGFVINNMETILSGVFTIKDETLLSLLKDFWKVEHIFLEPSAVAGALGPVNLFKTYEGQEYIQRFCLREKMQKATHIIWATGGSMVPIEEREEYLRYSS
jgi:D-serine dehydratase